MNKKHRQMKCLIFLVVFTIILPTFKTIEAKTGTQTIKATYRDINVKYNNKNQTISPEPFIVDGSVYVPLRAISTIFGVNAQWDPNNNTVFLTEKSTISVGTNVQTNYENEVLRLVNIQRAQNNMPSLIMDENLRTAARLKSTDMSNNSYFSHTSPTYGSPSNMLRILGINFNSAGENIAKGQTNASEVMASWMNSSGHRANILKPEFTKIGVGYNSNGHFWTQIFTS